MVNASSCFPCKEFWRISVVDSSLESPHTRLQWAIIGIFSLEGDVPIISMFISFASREAFGSHDKSFAQTRLLTEVKSIDTNHFSPQRIWRYLGRIIRVSSKVLVEYDYQASDSSPPHAVYMID